MIHLVSHPPPRTQRGEGSHRVGENVVNLAAFQKSLRVLEETAS